MINKKSKISDVGKDTNKLDCVEIGDLMPIHADWEEPPWTPISEQTSQAYACILDDTQLLPIPSKPRLSATWPASLEAGNGPSQLGQSSSVPYRHA